MKNADSEVRLLSDNEKRLLAREVAADDYDRNWPMQTTMGNLAREGFLRRLGRGDGVRRKEAGRRG